MDPRSDIFVYRNDNDMCIIDSATTHTILMDKKYFSCLTLIEASVNTIMGTTNLIEGSGRATLLLRNGTRLSIHNALYASRSRRNLLSFKDIRGNGYHVETTRENETEFLCITSGDCGEKRVLEKFPVLSSGCIAQR